MSIFTATGKMLAGAGLVAGGVVATPHAASATFSVCPVIATRPHYAVEEGYLPAMRVDNIGYTCHPRNQGVMTGFTEWQRCFPHARWNIFGIRIGTAYRCVGAYMGYGGKFKSRRDRLRVVAWRILVDHEDWRVAVHAVSLMPRMRSSVTVYSPVGRF